MSRRAKAERERIKAERRRKKGDDERSNRSDRGAAREARDAKPCQDLAARARFDPKAAERAKPGLGQRRTLATAIQGMPDHPIRTIQQVNESRTTTSGCRNLIILGEPQGLCAKQR